MKDGSPKAGDPGRAWPPMRAGGVLVMDVRPAAEYAAAHIAGVVSIPLDELLARLAELPRSAKLVAYCRGRFCVMSLDAVRLLRDMGTEPGRWTAACPNGVTRACPSPQHDHPGSRRCRRS